MHIVQCSDQTPCQYITQRRKNKDDYFAKSHVIVVGNLESFACAGQIIFDFELTRLLLGDFRKSHFAIMANTVKRKEYHSQQS